MGGKNRVVRLNNSGRHLGRWIDAELKLGLLSIVNRETLEKQGSESRTSASSKGVEDEESLETSAVVCQLADTVEDNVNNLS